MHESYLDPLAAPRLSDEYSNLNHNGSSRKHNAGHQTKPDISFIVKTTIIIPSVVRTAPVAIHLQSQFIGAVQFFPSTNNEVSHMHVVRIGFKADPYMNMIPLFIHCFYPPHTQYHTQFIADADAVFVFIPSSLFFLRGALKGDQLSCTMKNICFFLSIAL